MWLAGHVQRMEDQSAKEMLHKDKCVTKYLKQATESLEKLLDEDSDDFLYF
jgi:hypothetical protein